jgi:hypothetical protein
MISKHTDAIKSLSPDELNAITVILEIAKQQPHHLLQANKPKHQVLNTFRGIFKGLRDYFALGRE